MTPSSEFNLNNRSFYLMIDYYCQRNPIGKMYYSHSGYCHDFFSLTSLLMLIEEVISGEMFHTENAKRNFVVDEKNNILWDEKTYSYNYNTKESRGHLATFKIDVLFTQRNSWQGVIKWMDQEKILCFRSVFELIELIDNVLLSKQNVNQLVIKQCI